MQLTHRFRSMVDVAYREGLKFLTVGGVAYIVDTGLFNLLRLTVLDEKPITAKFISAAVATVVAWMGNRSWTFRHRRNRAPLQEFIQFVLVNAVGMAIMMGCLAISHYALGFTSPLADNIAANVVGLALSMVVRFWLYRTWVFGGTKPTEAGSQESMDDVAAGLAAVPNQSDAAQPDTNPHEVNRPETVRPGTVQSHATTTETRVNPLLNARTIDPREQRASSSL